MDRPRSYFIAAAILFGVWVACLGVLAVGWGRKPVVKPPAAKAVDARAQAE
jgi:hypothetical protein